MKKNNYFYFVCLLSALTFTLNSPAIAQDFLAPPLQAPLEEPSNNGQESFPMEDAFGEDVNIDSPAFSLPVDGPASLAAPDLDQSFEFDFEKTNQQLEQEARKEAYKAALESLLPLRPNEIRSLLERFDRTQESVALPIYPTPRAEIAVQTLPMDPGTRPAVIKVAYGHVTTVNIVDVTGSPWPIQDVSWAGDFDIMESGTEEGSHILRITPTSEFARGNMSLRMLTLQTPIIIVMQADREMVHYRFDAIIPERGPGADIPIVDSGISITAGNIQLASILEGIAPAESEKLLVSGVDGRTSAYRMNGMTYVRTPHSLLSPGWSSSVSSADGTTVYEIQDAPVLLLSDGGRMIRARLSEKRDIFDE